MADGRFSGNYGTDLKNLLGDPGGWLTGSNTGGFGGVKNMLFGDPNAIKAAYDKAMADAKAGGQDISNFLMHQQGKAQQYYQPLQHLFDAAYGTEGLKPQQSVPQAPLSALYSK